jgi:hypothetical protein
MLTRINDYKVEIANQKFVTDAGVVFSKTAIVTFSTPDKFGEIVEQFGYITAEDIYKLIIEAKDINVDSCYIENLSLAEYRNIHGLGKKEYVKIKSFSARNAFFNAHLKTDLSFAEFENGDISFENACFASGDLLFNSSKFNNGNVNFSYALFNCGLVDFANTLFGKGDISFKNVVFKKGIKDFQYANFGEGNVLFTNTEFNNGDVYFINSVFHNGDVSFKVARFGSGKKDFHYSKFNDCDVSFERTEFGDGRVDFRTVEYNEGKVNFNRAVFGNGGITFEACELKSDKFNFKKVIAGEGGLDFSMVEFANSEVYFDGCEFGKGSLNFYNSKFSKLSLKSCHLDYYTDLRLAKANYLDLSDTIVRDIIDLMPYDSPIDIKTINFEGIRLIGRIYLSWGQNNVLNLIESQTDTSEQSKGEQFRTLKQNFNQTGQYNDEDEAYVMFKRYESKAELHEAIKAKPLKAIWAYPGYAFKWLVFDKIGLYATSPARVLSSVVVIWFFFGLTYFTLQLIGLGKTTSSVGNPDNISVLVQSFYHSAITFFTIGYGDVFPQGLSRLFSAFEGFMGVFMMSYFTVAFVRKILR